MRQLKGVARVGDSRAGIAAIDLVAGEARVIAEVLLATPAIEARAVGPAEPRHADAVADGEALRALAEARHPAHDLMPEDEGQFGLRKLAVENVEIGAAHAASRNLDEDLAGSGCRDFHFRGPKRLPGRVQHHRLHHGRRHPLTYRARYLLA